MRQEQLTKLRGLFVSLGGLSADFENSANLLNAYVAANLQKTREQLAKKENNVAKKVKNHNRTLQAASSKEYKKLEKKQKASKLEIKRIKKKLAKMKRLKESIESAKELVLLTKEREKVKKEILCSEFSIQDNGSTSSEDGAFSLLKRRHTENA